jgi:hypothetical protein
LIDLKEDYSISHQFFFIEKGLRVGLCIIVIAIFIGGDRYLIYFDIFIPLAEVSFPLSNLLKKSKRNSYCFFDI